MAQPLLVNKYHHRKTADPKACWICFKPSTSVLITPDNQDFFYICAGHLKDRGFAIPDAAEVAAIAERQAKADLVKQGEREYAEMQKAKKQKEKDKKKDEKDDKEQSDQKSKDKDAEKKDDSTADQPKPDEKTTTTTEPEEPRTFALHKSFYQQRLDRIRNAEIAKRNRERLKNPSLFPSVPTGAPGQPPSST